MSSVPGKRSAFGFPVPIDQLIIGRRNSGPVSQNDRFFYQAVCAAICRDQAGAGVGILDLQAVNAVVLQVLRQSGKINDRMGGFSL